MKSYIRIFVLCLAMAALAAGVSLQERELQGKFNSWMRQHARSYDSDEFLDRYNTWRENMAWIEEFNSSGNKSFTVAMNQYGDFSRQEFARQFKGQHLPLEDLRQVARQQKQRQEEDAMVSATVPSTWDWRTAGAVTAVENQGSCGACWAFTASGAVSSANKIAGNALTVLSKQELVDCSGSLGNLGCSGGNVGLAYQWMINNNAQLVTETEYPYTASQGSCRYVSGGTVGVQNYATVATGSESALLTHAAVAPVTVAIDASLSSFMFYSGGYYYDASCSSSVYSLDHSVLLIGWGTDATYGDYWLVKNQWGTSWGDAGYAKMARNKSNNCGIATLAVRPCLDAACSTTPNTSA